MKTRLRLILADKNMTRQELAKQANVPYSFVRGIYDENIKRFDIDDLRKLCEFLECDLKDLIDFQKVA